MTTITTRTVHLTVEEPPIDYLVKVVTTTSGTGNPTFTLPTNIAAGDTIYCFVRLNKMTWTEDWGIFSVDTAEQAVVNNATNPFDVAWIGALSRYSNGTEAGDTITFDLTMFNSAGSGSIVPYDGEYDVVVAVLNGEYFVNGGWIDDNPVEMLDNTGYYEFTGTTIAANSLAFFVAGGYSSGEFMPTTLPTIVGEIGNLYVGARFYTNAQTYGVGGMSFNASGFFAATVLPLYVAG